MSVVVTTSGGQTVTVNAGTVLKSLGSESMAVSSAEQIMCEQPGGTPSQLTGYIDLSNLTTGDSVTVRFYVRLASNGNWGACYKETYSGVQTLPVVYIAKRPENHGIRVTVQQTAGTPKNITYEFFEEA